MENVVYAFPTIPYRYRPVIRTSVDGVFIFRRPVIARKSIWENYASIVPSFDMFCDIMDQLTGDYAIYIHNIGVSNKWQDCVFWYKARLIPDGWKVAHQNTGSFTNKDITQTMWKSLWCNY